MAPFACTLGCRNADRPEAWAVVKERRDEPAFVDRVRAAMREND